MAVQNKKAGHMDYEDWVKHWVQDDAPFHFPEPGTLDPSPTYIFILFYYPYFIIKITMAVQDKKAGHMDYEDWVKHWGQDDAPSFHFAEPDEIFVKNEAVILGDKTCKVFVPCCGKAEYMYWLYNKGHSVVGVEISEKACSDFFKEHKIDPVVEAIKNVGNVYQTKDKRIQLYAADVFKVTADLVGGFDVIWDSGALSVINKEDWPRYFELMKSMMKPDTMYFVCGVDYDKAVWPGPPHPLNEAELTEMCGGAFSIKLFHQTNCKEQGATDQHSDQPQGETTPQGGAQNEGKDPPEASLDETERAMMKSPFLFYNYLLLAQK